MRDLKATLSLYLVAEIRHCSAPRRKKTWYQSWMCTPRIAYADYVLSLLLIHQKSSVLPFIIMFIKSLLRAKMPNCLLVSEHDDKATVKLHQSPGCWIKQHQKRIHLSWAIIGYVLCDSKRDKKQGIPEVSLFEMNNSPSRGTLFLLPISSLVLVCSRCRNSFVINGGFFPHKLPSLFGKRVQQNHIFRQHRIPQLSATSPLNLITVACPFSRF